MPHITFTIITVTLNNVKGLERTAASLEQQNYSDVEWIIIDGDSRDGTKTFLKTTNATWESAPDNGIYDAMNKALARANGDYLLFLNAGDALANTATLSTIHKALKTNPSPALIYGDSWEDDHHKPARPHTQITTGLFTHHQAILYNRKALGDMRYNLEYSIAADYDLTARFLTKTQDRDILHIPQPLCIFESGGISQTRAKQGRIEQYKIRKKLKLCSPTKNALIYTAQSIIWTLRTIAPNLYWHLKSSRNNAPATAQNQTPPPHP